MEIYSRLIRVRDMVSLEANPDLWAKRAEVLAQIASQAFVNEQKKDEIPKGFYINNCELTLGELKELFVQLDLPVSRMTMEVTGTDHTTGQIFVEVFMN